MRRALRTLGAGLIVGGIGLIAWATITWLVGDPVTGLQTSRAQSELGRIYEDRFPRTQLIVAPDDPAAAAREHREGLRTGDPVGRLTVPRLDLDMLVVEGTDDATLKKGPGRYEKAFLPAEGELVYVAGHRTTYGAPFAHIDRLQPGDRIVFELPYGTFEYRVRGHRIVEDDAVEVLQSRGREELVLQACHPRFFATHRYLVYADPIDR